MLGVQLPSNSRAAFSAWPRSVLDELLHLGDTCGTTHQDDLIHLVLLQARILHNSAMVGVGKGTPQDEHLRKPTHFLVHLHQFHMDQQNSQAVTIRFIHVTKCRPKTSPRLLNPTMITYDCMHDCYTSTKVPHSSHSFFTLPDVPNQRLLPRSGRGRTSFSRSSRSGGPRGPASPVPRCS